MRYFFVLAVTLLLNGSVYCGMGWGQVDKRPEEIAGQQEAGDWKGPVRQRMSEWTGKLQEYRAGKRDHRDAYIILEKIYHMYGVMREQNSPEAQEVLREQKRLLQDHPELGKLKDFRLSDEIAAQRREKEDEKSRADAAARWVPKDNVIGRMFGSNQGRYAVTSYQYRLEFFDLPTGIDLKEIGDTSQFRPFKDGIEVPLTELRRKKTMTFRHPYHLSPMFQREDEVVTNFLICTDPLLGYVPKTDDEEKILKPRVTANAVPWVNRSGQHEHFCGIVSPRGDIVYDFKFQPRMPGRLIRPLFVSQDGKYAVLMVGERIYDRDNLENQALVGKPKEVWLWTHPQELIKKRISDASVTPKQLMKMYRK